MLASADLDFFIFEDVLRLIAMSVGPVVIRSSVTLFDICRFLEERFRRNGGGGRFVTETVRTGLKLGY